MDSHSKERHRSTRPLAPWLFPELWYSWRHQIDFLANHGYHVVAPDLRGFGDSDAPLGPTSYTVFHVVGDLIGIIDHFGQEKNNGFDHLSVPYHPRSPNTKSVESLRELLGDGFHVVQFQEPGRAERAFAKYDYLTVFKKFLLLTDHVFLAPPGMDIIDYMETPASLPPWINEEELKVYADKYEETGFTNPLNYYRAMDLELLAPWQGSKIMVPTKFIVGDKDIGFEIYGTKNYIQGDGFKKNVPNLQEVVILDGHWPPFYPPIENKSPVKYCPSFPNTLWIHENCFFNLYYPNLSIPLLWLVVINNWKDLSK